MNFGNAEPRFSKVLIGALLVTGMFGLGCEADFDLRQGVTLTCEGDSDCPDGSSCTLNYDGSLSVCVTPGRPHCGNGVLESDELCDHGNENTTDYGEPGRCNTTCDGYAPHCGDAVLNGAEACDRGIDNTDEYGDGSGCNTQCSGLPPYCGDGERNGGEFCDAGGENTDLYGVAGRCNATCSDHAPYCGDDRVDPGELCDDGAANNATYQSDRACNALCDGYASFCGDGEVNAPMEACDNPDPLSGCTPDCQPSEDAVCGDGIHQFAVEECDDGVGETGEPETEVCSYGLQSCYVCDVVCSLREIDGTWCGDGIRQPEYGELCDSDTKPCAELSPEFGSGTASCTECGRWDTAGCVVELDDPNKMVLIEGGLFFQGCNEDMGEDCEDDREHPYHPTLVDTFYIDTYEVTVARYRDCVAAGACDDSGLDYDVGFCNYGFTDREDHPVNCVSWYQASAYCTWALKSLPTEAEWEKAARGIDGQIYPWGSTTVDCTYAVMDSSEGDGCGEGRTWAVGSKPAGATMTGAFDMAGNVYEWTSDWYGSNYYCAGDEATTFFPFAECDPEDPVSPEVTDNPEGPPTGYYKVLKGGSYSTPFEKRFRPSYRYRGSPGQYFTGFGFRCAY